jgi:hypothetical protein
MIDYAIILDRKYKGKGQWSITDNDYNQFIWQSDKPKPTKKELDDLWIQVESDIKGEAEAKATAKAALLSKLGITAEEARLLLS